MQLAPLFHLVWPYVLQLGGVAFAAFLAKKVHTATDSQRAQAIATIAKDIAAAVYTNNPSLTWLDLVKQVVEQLAAQTGLTENPLVLQRAATGALMSLGVKRLP